MKVYDTSNYPETKDGNKEWQKIRYREWFGKHEKIKNEMVEFIFTGYSGPHPNVKGNYNKFCDVKINKVQLLFIN